MARVCTFFDIYNQPSSLFADKKGLSTSIEKLVESNKKFGYLSENKRTRFDI